MTDVTRRSLLAAVGVAAAAGCLTGSDDGPGEDSPTPDAGGTTTGFGGETPRTESRERTTTDSADETTGGDWIERASNEPNPDHSITLENRADAAKTVRVRVEREETGETVFEATETVDPGVELDLYNLKEANPDGVEPFEICGELVESEATTDDAETRTTGELRTTVDTERTTTASERRDCAPLRTNKCYGNAHVTVQEDDSLQVIYAIC